ncbi:MAG: hypothetical protein M3Q97_05380 [Bacteroidota bacterium]|nr:hypothetical protein [Bacteroidota bacterium]
MESASKLVLIKEYFGKDEHLPPFDSSQFLNHLLKKYSLEHLTETEESKVPTVALIKAFRQEHRGF